jgi:hypothetical protein
VQPKAQKLKLKGVERNNSKKEKSAKLTMLRKVYTKNHVG